MLYVNRSLIQSVLDQSYLFPGVTAVQIQKEIRDNKLAFLYLTSQRRGPVSAFEEVHRMLTRGEDPAVLWSRAEQRRYQTLRDFHGYGDLGWGRPDESFDSLPPRPLPDWLKDEIRVFLSQNTTDFKDGEFNFWLPAKLLLTSSFAQALRLARRRWRIPDHLTRPLVWFEQMNADQQKAVDFALRNGYNLDFRDRTTRLWKEGSFAAIADHSVLLMQDGSEQITFGDGRPGAILFPSPFDQRRLDTYQAPDRRTFGLPIVDYEQDLNVLTWLAGGMPSDLGWRCWTESFLWDFQDLPFGTQLGGPATKFWTETERNRAPLRVGRRPDPEREGWSETYGRIRMAPKHVTTLAATPIKERPPVPGVTFLSRWIDVAHYPTALQADLVYSFIEYWAEYEPPLSRPQMRLWLEKSLRPITRKEALRLVDYNLGDDWSDLSEADTRALAAARQRQRRLRK